MVPYEDKGVQSSEIWQTNRIMRRLGGVRKCPQRGLGRYCDVRN